MGETFDDASLGPAPTAVEQSDSLVIALECDRPLAGGARLSLAGIEKVVIGRGATREAWRSSKEAAPTLHVRVPGRSMSATHARLVRMAGGWAVEDCASTNGTFVDGARTTCAPFGARAVLELGHTLFRLVPATVDAADVLDGPTDPARPTTLDPALNRRLDAVEKLASSKVSMLLLGESGSGKEVLARWIHERSGRPGKFVAINCAAIPEALVESTLFGHVKGAFSGAVRDEPGFVRAAAAGTLFLDEIADLPRPSQAALLRVLQEREVVPVGTTQAIPVDVRVLAATHAALGELAETGDFRRDLYARVAGATITLPPLRERTMDLGLLIASILPRVAPQRAESTTFSSDAGRALLRYAWPLNVRELEQCLASSTALAGARAIGLEDLPAAVAASLRPAPSTDATEDEGLGEGDQRRRAELLASLARHRGNLAEVARDLGKARMQIHRWCKRFGIDPNAFRR